MLSVTHQAIGVLICAFLVGASLALPKCDEDCRDSRMHPSEKGTFNRASLRAALNGENQNDFWRNKAKQVISQKLQATPNTKKAKNVILFIGDGMGLTTVAAARNLLGGEQEFLSFEKFPYTGLSKTYSVSHIVPDSAGTGTAYMCGVKTNNGMLGVTAKLPRASCEPLTDSNKVYSIAKWALDAGKSAGVVTTTRITHATPAAAYAQVSERNWEYNTPLERACGKNTGFKDIAYQLIYGEVGSRLKVAMGGGRRNFRDETISSKGYRTDGKDLINEFKSLNAKNMYFSNRSELMSADLGQANRVLGLFRSSHLAYQLKKTPEHDEPSLAEMTTKAIELLSQNEQGFFLLVEDGSIDLAHHDNKARYSLSETVELSKAVEAALTATNSEETLIVVTADHSHAFSYSGYAPRGNDIFDTTSSLADDGKQYMALSYANGPGHVNNYDTATNTRLDPASIYKGELNEVFPAALPLSSETHGGDDVPVFANGPNAHLFTGMYEENNIPHIMAYASCVGAGLKTCDN